MTFCSIVRTYSHAVICQLFDPPIATSTGEVVYVMLWRARTFLDVSVVSEPPTLQPVKLCHIIGTGFLAVSEPR